MRKLILRLIIASLTFAVGIIVNLAGSVCHPAKVDEPEIHMPIQRAEAVSSPDVVSPTEPKTEPTSPFDPSGDYHPTNPVLEGPLKLTYFDLDVRRRKNKLVAWGHVSSPAGFYKFAAISVTKERLTFTTVNKGGVRYSFEGHFLGGGTFSISVDLGEAMLEGKLQKFVNGTTVAEVNSTFMYYAGC